MANICQGCGTKWPPEPVIMIVLGQDWHEYGACCMDDDAHAFVNQQTGERVTPRELFELLGDDSLEG